MNKQARSRKPGPMSDRLKALRTREGLSRADVARRIGVDVTSIAGWETGKYLPRDGHRAAMAKLFGIDSALLFSTLQDAPAEPVRAVLVDTLSELPEVLEQIVARTQKSIKALCMAAPYPTAAHVQVKFRCEVSRRILDRSLEVQRAEIFYNLARLKEVLSNILRYDGCPYYVKSYCPGLKDVAPLMGGYFFDNSEFVVGSYWASVPPHERPSMRLSGEPFQTYFHRFWNEIWQRGTLLNFRGAHDLEEVKVLALQLGLSREEWPQFLKEAIVSPAVV